MSDADPPAMAAPAPPPRADFATLVRQGAWGPSQKQIDQLAQYRDALFAHNKTTNLTAIRELDGIERRLILESLRLVGPLLEVIDMRRPGPAPVLDIGTGGGLPGLVLAIALPSLTFTLLDATRKKIAFVQHVAETIGLHNVFTIHGRAEDVAHDPRFRGAFSVAVARAVSSIPALLELGLPLLRPNGHLLLPKGLTIDDELEQGNRAAAELGGTIVGTSLLPEVGSGIETRLVIVEKIAPTPGAFPRPAGIPSRKPLGERPETSRSRPSAGT